MAKTENLAQTKDVARAKALNLSISTKHGVEISNFLRYKRTDLAKKLMEEVIELKRAVPFRRFDQDLGHKAGMSGGRFPQKAAQEFLRLIKTAEANAQVKGFDITSLKIVKLVANKAAIPMTGSRLRYATKRTHLEIEVAPVKVTKIVKEKSVKKTKEAPVKEATSHKKEKSTEGVKTS